jgi:hypothetical protein
MTGPLGTAPSGPFSCPEAPLKTLKVGHAFAAAMWLSALRPKNGASGMMSPELESKS